MRGKTISPSKATGGGAASDLYSLLGVTRKASRDEIRAAYKQRALDYHPDKNPSGEYRFKQVLHAYQTLVSPSKRSRYDTESGTTSGAGVAAPSGDTYTSFYRTSGERAAPQNRTYYAERTKRSQEEFHRHAQGFSAQNITFSEWFKKKQTEWTQMEHDAKVRSELLRTKMHQRMAAEEAEQRDRLERERRERLEQERVEELRRLEDEQRERERVRQQRAQKQQEESARVQETLAKQHEQVEVMERLAKELAEQRAALQREREQCKSEALAHGTLNAMYTLSTPDRKQRERERIARVEQEVLKAEAELEQRRAQLASHTLRLEQEEAHRKQQELVEEERLRMLRAQQQAQEEEWNAQLLQRERERQKTREAMSKKAQRIFAEVEAARKKQEEHLQELRQGHDRVEEEMQETLKALRAAKAQGKPLEELNRLREKFDSLVASIQK